MKWTVFPPCVTASTRQYNPSTTGISPQTYRYIDNALANDDPVIAEVHWAGKPVDSHFVVITGRNGDTYNIIDPWGGVATTLENGALGHYIIDHYRWFSSSSPTVVEKGLCWLRTTQNPDGSWSNNVGVTSLAVLCFLNAGYDETDPDVRDAIGYICSKVQDDGRITTGSDTYETSLAILALVATHNSSYSIKIENATNWVNNSQWDKDCLWENVDKDNWYYGGFGYGSHSRPDMSNTQFALMALDAVQSISKDDILWDKAQVFLARTQNRQEDVYIPDLDYTVEWNPTYNKYDDGGFVYYPGASLAGDVNSYGSMTGAGIWGLRLCNVPINVQEGRVQEALDWLIDNYMMDGNPGMSNPGTFQYYYYLSMSKALTMTEPDLIGGHNWYQDLSDNLTALQKPEGYWVNDRDTWCWENNKDLVTSYAILSLQTLAEIPEDIQRLSYITVILHSNADLHVYDPFGRHAGKNYETGGIDLEIPNATYTSNGAQNITIPGLETGNYRIVLVGIGTGEYTLNVTGGVGNDTVSEDSYTATISEGEVQDSTVNVAMITWLTIHVDVPEPIDPIVPSATGTGNVSFIADSGTIVNITALNETDLPAENPNVDFPHGLFSFNITGLDLGQTVNITIAFPQDIPTTAQYWKYHTPEGWYLIPMGSNDGDNIITITLQDGGMGDDDGDANGVIVDHGGPGIPVAAPNITSFAPLSPVNDTVCNWRTFNITVNQTVNMSWYVNGSLLSTNHSVTEANYTLHADVVRVLNVTAIAANNNGTDMQTWIWDVTGTCTPIGGFSVALLPKLKPANAGEVCDFTVRLRNTQNFVEYVDLDLSLSGIPAEYAANLAWFNWTTSALSIPAGEYRDIGLRVDIPDGFSGYKSFGIIAHGTFGDSKDYGVVNVTLAP